MLMTEPSEITTKAGQQKTHVVPVNQGNSCSDWRSMFDRDPQSNPFQHPDYVLAELQAAGPSALSRSAMVRLETDSQLDGIGILVPKSVRTGQVGGIGPSWTLQGLRLVGGAFLTADPSLEAQLELLTTSVSYCAAVGADFLLIEDLDEQSPLYHAVQQGSTNGFTLFAAREIQPRWRIEFPTREEDYWKTFSGRTRRAFRNRLKKFGATHLERITDPEQVPNFLAAAHEISKQSWQSRQFGLRIRNDESELRRMTVLAQQGFLRSYLWQVEGKPAAFALGHQHAGCFRYEEIAYCAQFSAMSPGETMLQQIVEDLYRHDLPTSFDFGGGDAEYKRRFGNRESRSQTVWLVPPTWRASSSLAYLNGCRGLRSAARSAVNTCGLATKARQWLRYGGRSAQPKATMIAASSSDQDTDSTESTGAMSS